MSPLGDRAQTQEARSPCPRWETRLRPKKRNHRVPAGRHGSDPKSEITLSPLGDTVQTQAKSPCPLWETGLRPKRRDRHVPAGRHGSDPKSEIAMSPLGDTVQTQAKSPCPRWETRLRPKKRNHHVPSGRHGSDPDAKRRGRPAAKHGSDRVALHRLEIESPRCVSRRGHIGRTIHSGRRIFFSVSGSKSPLCLPQGTLRSKNFLLLHRVLFLMVSVFQDC